MKRYSLTGHPEPNGEFVLYEDATEVINLLDHMLENAAAHDMPMTATEVEARNFIAGLITGPRESLDGAILNALVNL